MVSLNATVFPDEAYVLVQADWSGAAFRDTFSRVSASGWGNADTGQAWSAVVGAAGDFTVNGTQGLVTHAVVNTDRLIVADVNMADVIYTGYFTNTGVPTGAGLEVKIAARFVDASNFVDARMFLNTNGTVTTNLRQRIAGVDTTSATVLIPGIASTGVYGYTLYAVGGTLAFRAWNATGPEPATWVQTFTTTMLSAGDVGVGSFVDVAVTTAVPIIFSHDNMVAYDPALVTTDCAFVTRRNTVTGEIVSLRPYVFYNADGALILECGQGLWWDTEPPLDVPLEYCTTACDAEASLSGNCCFEGGSVAPWTATNGVLTSSTAFSHEGLSSGLLTPTGAVIEPHFSQGITGIVAGVPLTVSAWVMSPQGWNAVTLRLEVVYSDLTTETVNSPVEIIDDGEWRYLSLTFTPTSAGTATFSFYTLGLPPNTTLFYVDQIQATQAVDVTATACETVTVEGEGFWLKSPLHPCLDVAVGICNPMLEDCDEDSRVSFASMPEENYSPNTVLLAPVNRRRPLPINRVRRDVEATLRLIAHDCTARDAVLAINEPGDPLLWQAPADYCTPDRYMSVGVLGELKISVDHREDFRLMSLPHVAVDRPEGPADGVCGARIADLCDIYTSWGAMSTAGLTWEDLLLGNASPSGPGQDPAPAAARTWDEVETEFADWDAVEAGGTRDWDELRDGL